jgi:hypothetical protein
MSKLSNTTQHNLATFGQLGSDYVASGAVTVPSGKSIVAITALAETNITSLAVSATGTDASFTDNVTIPAGVTVYGKWTAATSSAAAIAYFG